jgi:hypothetical protein
VEDLDQPGDFFSLFFYVSCASPSLLQYIVISLVLFDGFNFDFVAGLILCFSGRLPQFLCAFYCCTSMTNMVWFIDPLLQLSNEELVHKNLCSILEY